jgi:hypothetical protein
MGPHRAPPAALPPCLRPRALSGRRRGVRAAVLGWYRRRARRAGWANGHSGSVTVIQRFGSGLQLNVHGHALVLDGVFTEATDGTLRFHPAAAPTDLEVAGLVATTRTRVLCLLRRRLEHPQALVCDPGGEERRSGATGLESANSRHWLVHRARLPGRACMMRHAMLNSLLLAPLEQVRQGRLPRERVRSDGVAERPYRLGRRG